MLRSIAKSTLRPLWQPLRHRLEHLIRLQVAPLETVVQEQTSALASLVEQMEMDADRARRHLRRSDGPKQLYPFPRDDDHVGPETILQGSCPVCGQTASFSQFTSNPRESGACSCCGSFNRQRQMAGTVRKCFALPPH